MVRESEALEKINEAYRQISVGTFDGVSGLRKPAKSDIDGVYIFCRFVNAFRPMSEQWDTVSLQQWQTMMSFLLYSPNRQKICLEIQQIKKRVLRPHISRVSQETYKTLSIIRESLMSNLEERTLNVHFKHNQVVRKLVILVLISINHLVPVEKVPEQEAQPIGTPVESSTERPLLTCLNFDDESKVDEEAVIASIGDSSPAGKVNETVTSAFHNNHSKSRQSEALANRYND